MGSKAYFIFIGVCGLHWRRLLMNYSSESHYYPSLWYYILRNHVRTLYVKISLSIARSWCPLAFFGL